MYINFMIKKNINIYISYWLLLITFLVALMIIVGGLTRLTDSGLSITKWDLISGIIPPLSLMIGKNHFHFINNTRIQVLNSSMTLDQFKIIYWWEYIHRLLGRIVGLFYLIPLFILHYKKIIKKNSLISLFISFCFLYVFRALLDGIWLKAVLIRRTDVSHYRLALTFNFSLYHFYFTVLELS